MIATPFLRLWFHDCYSLFAGGIPFWNWLHADVSLKHMRRSKGREVLEGSFLTSCSVTRCRTTAVFQLLIATYSFHVRMPWWQFRVVSGIKANIDRGIPTMFITSIPRKGMQLRTASFDFATGI
jgi:hypothetical protein